MECDCSLVSAGHLCEEIDIHIGWEAVPQHEGRGCGGVCGKEGGGWILQDSYRLGNNHDLSIPPPTTRAVLCGPETSSCPPAACRELICGTIPSPLVVELVHLDPTALLVPPDVARVTANLKQINKS